MQFFTKASGNIREAIMDLITRAITIIEYEHHEIHGGSSYHLSQITAENALDIAAPLTFHITPPASGPQMHLILAADVADAAKVEIFEDDGNASHFDVSGGSAVTPVNRNRNSSNTSGATIKTGVTVTQATTDVLLCSMFIGGKKEGGGGASRQELILESGVEYLVRLTSIADNNEGSFAIDWYEHTPKT